MSPVSADPRDVRDAPAGTRVQDFDVEIPSASTPGKTYRLTRSPSGELIHLGACPAFRWRGNCRHVRRALALVERPVETLLEDLEELVADGRGRSHDPERLRAWAVLLGERVDQAIEAQRSRERFLAYEEAWARLSPAERQERAFARMGDAR